MNLLPKIDNVLDAVSDTITRVRHIRRLADSGTMTIHARRAIGLSDR
jgi:hypothetical protein